MKQRHVYRGKRRQLIRALKRALNRRVTTWDPKFKSQYRLFTSLSNHAHYTALATRCQECLDMMEEVPQAPATGP
jgi:hypothetical protein